MSASSWLRTWFTIVPISDTTYLVGVLTGRLESECPSRSSPRRPRAAAKPRTWPTKRGLGRQAAPKPQRIKCEIQMPGKLRINPKARQHTLEGDLVAGKATLRRVEGDQVCRVYGI